RRGRGDRRRGHWREEAGQEARVPLRIRRARARERAAEEEVSRRSRMTRTPSGTVTHLVVLLAALAFVACSTKPPKRPAEDDTSKAFAALGKEDKPQPNADARAPERSAKGPAYPAPFTAEQIRDATKEGRTYRFKVD